MNTLDDLRTSLDRRAESFTDHEATARPAAVRRRIAVARRRRSGTAAGALVAVLAVVGSVVSLRPWVDRGPEVLGQRVPATMSSLGYTYRATGTTYTFDGRGAVTFAPADRPRLLSWTTDEGSSVHVIPTDGDRVDSSGPAFHDFVFIPAHERGRVMFRVDRGRVGVATYDLTDAVPAGVSRDGITFRQRVADVPLLAAAIGPQGESELRTSFVAPRGQVDVAVLCAGLPRGYEYRVAMNGDGYVSSDCRGGDTFDPGASGTYRTRTSAPGSTVNVHVYVVRRSTGVRVSTGLDQVRVGVGIYGPAALVSTSAGRLPTVTESGGHTYRIGRVVPSHGRTVVLHPDNRTPRLLTVAWDSHGQIGFRVGVDGDVQATPRSASGQAAVGGLWVPAGTREVRVERTLGHGPFSATLYQRID